MKKLIAGAILIAAILNTAIAAAEMVNIFDFLNIQNARLARIRQEYDISAEYDPDTYTSIPLEGMVMLSNGHFALDNSYNIVHASFDLSYGSSDHNDVYRTAAAMSALECSLYKEKMFSSLPGWEDPVMQYAILIADKMCDSAIHGDTDVPIYTGNYTYTASLWDFNGESHLMINATAVNSDP